MTDLFIVTATGGTKYPNVWVSRGRKAVKRAVGAALFGELPVGNKEHMDEVETMTAALLNEATDDERNGTGHSLISFEDGSLEILRVGYVQMELTPAGPPND